MESFPEPARALVAQMTAAAAAEPSRAVAFQGAPGANSHIAAREAFPDCLPLPCFSFEDALDAVNPLLTDRLTVFLGHSGVGKSTLVNRLVPEADRATGEVSGVGKGKHTSTQSVALPLRDGGWVIDTPGVRSFGLAHVRPDDVLLAFSDLAAAIGDCPRGCGHLGPPTDPECALDELTGPAVRRVAAARVLLGLLRDGVSPDAAEPTR